MAIYITWQMHSSIKPLKGNDVLSVRSKTITVKEEIPGKHKRPRPGINLCRHLGSL